MRSAALARDFFRNLAEKPVGLKPRKLRKITTSEMVTRFGFGSLAATVAGVIALTLGNRVGGLFLAFPSILPASITLIAKQHGREKAEIDAAGATIGALSLIGFAATSLVLIGHLPIVAVEGCALAVWFAVSAVVYFGVRALIRR
jgi:hypothetical protein